MAPTAPMATSRRRPPPPVNRSRPRSRRRRDRPRGGGHPDRAAPAPEPPAGPRSVDGGDRGGGVGRRHRPGVGGVPGAGRRSGPRLRRRGPGPPGRGHVLVGLLSGGHRDGGGDHRLPDQLHHPGGRRHHDQCRAGGTSRRVDDGPSHRGGPPVGHGRRRPVDRVGQGQQRLVVHLRRGRRGGQPGGVRTVGLEHGAVRVRGRPPSGPSPAGPPRRETIWRWPCSIPPPPPRS